MTTHPACEHLFVGFSNISLQCRLNNAITSMEVWKSSTTPYYYVELINWKKGYIEQKVSNHHSTI